MKSGFKRNVFFSLTLVFISSLLLSCRDDGAEAVEDSGKVSGIRELNSQEMQVLERICDSLKGKHDYFASLPSHRYIFNFELERRVCGSPDSYNMGQFEASLVIPRSGEFRFLPHDQRLLVEDIITHRQGVMKSFCRELELGGVVSNTFEISSREIHQLRVGRSGNFDSFEVRLFNSRGGEQFEVFHVDAGQVYTASSTNDSTLEGVLRQRVLHKRCGQTQSFELYRQTYRSRRHGNQ